MDDDYGQIRGRRDVWAFTECAPVSRSRRPNPMTDANILRIMQKTFPDREFKPSLSAQVRAAARERRDDIPY